MVGWRGLVVVALCAVVCVPAALAIAPGNNGLIAFTSDRSGDNEIYVMALDGSGVMRLTNDPGNDMSPAFSPGGKRIAFQSTRPGFNDVFVMDADGSSVKNLSNLGGDDLDPSWSPGGTKIVFARNQGGNYEIFSMDAADGSNKQNLTSSGDGELNPTWDPDGTRIVYIRNVGGNNFELWAMDTDGSHQRSLTSTSAAEYDPAFSPGGSRIAFITDRDGNAELYSMAVDGTDVRRLTNTAVDESRPAWSPDATRLLFSRGGEIYSVRASDGSNLVRLAADPATDTDPDWAVAQPTPAPTPTSTPIAGATVTPSPQPTATPQPTPTPTPEPTSTPIATATPRPTPGAAVAPGELPPPAVTRNEPPTLPAAPNAASRPGAKPRPASTPRSAATPTPTAAPSTPAAAAPPPDPPAGRLQHGRASFVQLLARPDDLFVSAADIGRSIGLAILLAALLGFPARLWNMTWKGNRRALSAWLHRLGKRLAWLTPSRGAVLTSFAGTSVAIAAAVHWFLDPGFPSRRGSGAFALGMVLGIATIVTLLVTAWRRSVRQTNPENRLHWHVYPGQILVSIVCVSVSRLAHFVPGLIFGMAGDLEPHRPLTLEDNGRATARAGTAMLLLSLSAWVLSIPVGRSAAHADASFGLLTLDATLAVIAVSGMEYLVFMLAPFVFLDGYDLARWRPAVWATLWGTAVLWLSLVILNPALNHYQGEAKASIAWLGGLLAFEVFAAFALWAFFVARNRARTSAGTG
ncbi:MAG: hypothetical protein QOI80_3121 [Solirubrobacteraceae bacterium]|nr:hypothetical protein [Solirubrobacteraceae bacterium]